MAIRLRTVDGIRVALCAAETDPMPDDLCIDDVDHYALAAKFSRDFDVGIEYPDEWAAMDKEKRRDAAEMCIQWDVERRKEIAADLAQQMQLFDVESTDEKADA